ncbi:MAG: DNA methyltransferase, partial [Pseudomonadota bacterium]
MARKQRTSKETKELFRDPSGQVNLFEKSYQEELEAKAKKSVECLGMTFENDEARRAYFLEKLKEKLKDPGFRKIEGFPIGSDEDILALSDPPYYTACPNPFIEDFIRCYGKPYDSKTDKYRREPFAADVSEGKNDAIYNAHAYHTKVSYLAIRRYICHFTQPGDLVLDFFGGTGMTGVASQKSEGGERRCLLIDLSPVATHVAGAFTSISSLSAAKKTARSILDRVRSEYDWMYETEHCGWPAGERDPRKRVHHSSNRQLKARINFVVWSDIFLCPECGSEINFWKAAVNFDKERVLDDFECPRCQVLLKRRGLDKAMKIVFDPALKQTISVTKQEPVLINYTYNGTRHEKDPDDADLETLSRIERSEIKNWHPTARMPEGDESRRNDPSGITHVHHFYPRRNLIALAALRKEAENERALLFWFTSTLPWCGRENRLHMSNYFGKKGGQITSLRGTLYVPSLSVETNVFERFDLRVKSALVNSGSRNNGCIVATNSATSLRGIPNDTVDYIFVDPPFGANLMYSELNYIWEAWLRVNTNTCKEAIINKTQKKDLFGYQELMARSFREGHHVLKPNRWMTIEFHNSKNSVWNVIQEALQNAGFVIADVRTLDKGKGSFKQVTSAGAVKQDLIISAYKSNGGLEERFKLTAGTEGGMWDFVRTHLRQLPVFVSKDDQAEVITERQNYLLFDRMVAFHVQRGVAVPLSAAEFYQGLAQRFSERDGMYFLPDQVAEYDRKRMTVKEILQLELFVIDESSAI